MCPFFCARQTYCGKEALDNLAVGALVHRSKELTEPPQVQKAVHSQHGEQAAIQAASTQNADSALIKREEEASPPVQIGLLQARPEVCSVCMPC